MSSVVIDSMDISQCFGSQRFLGGSASTNRIGVESQQTHILNDGSLEEVACSLGAISL